MPEAVENLLLRSLPQATLKRMWPALEWRQTARGEVLEQADAPVEFVLFVNGGLVSLIKDMSDGRAVEVGEVGIEGIVASGALLGLNRSVVDAIVEIPGAVFRLKRSILAREIERDSTLRDLIGRYTRYAFNQMVQIAACNRLHHIEERCCRWLLTAQDNARADTFPLTQEYLAIVLGVLRGGVTEVAHALQENDIINYRRGVLTVRNRAKLEAMACECYRTLHERRAAIFRGYPCFTES
ncbi:MAG: Crp/Fnr family transcriptional regulator [Alphaproteobacteria bacterium]|nr:MAG: Crp/Fnr family transcriptional regulator [Alphaproteobacteria bacterium]